MRAIIVGIYFGKGDFEASMEELHLLVQSDGGQVVGAVTGSRKTPDAALFAGSGKVE